MSWKEPKVSLTPQATLLPQDIHPQDIKPEIKDLLYFASHATALRPHSHTVNLVGVAPEEASPSSSGLVKVEPSSASLIPLPSPSTSRLPNLPVLTTDDSAIMPPPPPPPPRPPTSPGVSSTSDQESVPGETGPPAIGKNATASSSVKSFSAI